MGYAKQNNTIGARSPSLISLKLKFYTLGYEQG